MLRGSTLYANLKAPDLDAAVEFYAGKLGLTVLWDGEIMPRHREVLFLGGRRCRVHRGGRAAAEPKHASELRGRRRRADSRGATQPRCRFRGVRPSEPQDRGGGRRDRGSQGGVVQGPGRQPPRGHVRPGEALKSRSISSVSSTWRSRTRRRNSITSTRYFSR